MKLLLETIIIATLSAFVGAMTVRHTGTWSVRIAAIACICAAAWMYLPTTKKEHQQ